MKVLLSAYACEPGKGSEPEVGLRTLLIAAREHDVWVLTRENNIPALRAHIRSHPSAARVHLVGLDIPGPLLRHKKRHPLMAHLYYDQWQRAAAVRAQELDRQVGFDLAHHVTFAAYWKRAGVSDLRKPLVWGPVGGGVRAPLRLARRLPFRGLVEELARRTARPLAGAVGPVRRTRRRCAHILVQNADTARRLKAHVPVTVLPNALAVDVSATALCPQPTRSVVVVGNLIPWKAVDLALDAFAAADVPGTQMLVVGDGPLRGRLVARARALDLGSRVEFLGQRPRDDVLRIVGEAGLLLHTALHEEAGWAVAEALALGTPVVSLDHGGPAELLRQWPTTPSAAVSANGWRDTADALGDAIRRMLIQPGPDRTCVRAPVLRYDNTLLDVYAAVADTRVARQ